MKHHSKYIKDLKIERLIFALYAQIKGFRVFYHPKPLFIFNFFVMTKKITWYK